jgi:flagellar protein FliT
VQGAELLTQYEAILHHSRLMLEAARQGDWDNLIAIEQDRASLNSLLQNHEKLCRWLEEDQIRKGDLIRKILANDEETKGLVEPRRLELQNIFGSLYAEKKLLSAYAKNA